MAKKKQAVAAPDEIELPGIGIAIEFKLAKVTAQGALRYEELVTLDENTTSDMLKVGTVYIQKGTLPEPAPDRIRITIETI